MFSPAIRKPHLLHRRCKEEASPSPPPAPAHTPSTRGFAVHDCPATGTPAPWTSSSLLARISTSTRTGRTGDSGQIQPVHVAEFPQVVRNAQANLLQKSFPGKNLLAGGIDKETSLAWMICGNELFIWSYLATVAKDCLVLEVPSSLLGNKGAKSLCGSQWTVCIMRWGSSGASTRSSGDMLHRRSSTGVILCNKRTQAMAYWPDIYTENSKSPVLGLFGCRDTSSDDGTSGNCRISSLIAAAVPGGINECIVIASEPTGTLWLFQCSPAAVNRREIHKGSLGIHGADRSRKNSGGGSLAWLPIKVSSVAAERMFFLLTSHELQCWSISFLHDINCKKIGCQEIVGSDGDLGIKKDIAGQKNIWLLDMQIDEHGKEIDILVATFCKDRVSGSNYTQYSLLTMLYKPNQKFSSEDNVIKTERFLEKKAPSQVIIPKARVEDEEFLFSMRLKTGGKPSGSVIILSGDGTATVAIYWRGSTRLYQFDLPWDAGKVLDASVIPSSEDRDEGAWVVLTEKAGVWAIPEKAVLVGGVEPPERSLSRKGSCNEAVAEEKRRSQALNSNVVPRRASSEAWSAGERQRPSLTGLSQQAVVDEESEMLLNRLFHDFILSGTVHEVLQKLRAAGAFDKEGEMNIFVRISKSIVNTLSKHWTTTREAEFLASTVVSSLTEKQQKHEKFLQFLVLSKCHEELSSKQRTAMLTVMEHGEKLSGMIQLRELQNTLSHQRSSINLSPQSKNQTTGALWNLIQLIGEKARRNTVLLMDRDNAEVFYSRVSDIEDLFHCLSHQLQYIITGEENPSVQMQRALELSNACMTLVQAGLRYREQHKDWYPSPEGLITWNSQPVVRSGIWRVASFVMEFLKEPGAADMSMKSNLWSQLEGLTDILLDAYIGLLTAKFERGEEHGVLVQEYCDRRDELLGSLYDLAKQIVDAKYQESTEVTDNLDLKESIFREVTSPILATAKRHEGYQTLWQICYDLSDTGLLRSLMHDSVGPHGGFSFFVFKQLLNRRQHAKLLRLGEEFQEDLASFLKERDDLLWLHEIRLNQFSSASETLHTCALHVSPEEGANLTSNRKPLSFVDRRRFLYLSKIAAAAGKDVDYEVKVVQIDADIRILNLQEEIIQHDPEYAHDKYTSKPVRPLELIEMCLRRDRELSLKAFEVFAWTSASFRCSNRGLLEACWMNATDQDDWVSLSQESEGWSDERIQESLQGTVLFNASRLCYSRDAVVYGGSFEEVLPVKKEDLQLRGLEGRCLSVEEVLMQHKDFPDAGKLMMTAVIMGKELPDTVAAAEPVEMDS
ncbi:nuclear pore complex protein NUP133 isoform X2 [Oryza brachyantha]|uniref:Nucleoporin Nup133/Nup155-like N-terminal domain-containing protein n=1 Tax=Oryza brachyantha TaxID=4533 RepID=J3LLJ6_ORYBR|nr:nuclear pore complex protein NUP133 isoform X2 [Oryza brachyantha]